MDKEIELQLLLAEESLEEVKILSDLVKLGIFERFEKGKYKLKTHHESKVSQQ